MLLLCVNILLSLMSHAAGNVFVVVAPSGAGKSSLVNALLAQDPSLCLSVSATTRAPRSGEIDGKDYRFVSKADFVAMQQSDQLLEWAEVHGNLYGTPRDQIDQAIEQGRDVLLEIDWQGARQVKRLFTQTIGIFILPPSIQVLEQRLQLRGQDSQEVIARRIQAASDEILRAPECEYVIINQDFRIALAELTEVIAVARLRYGSQSARNKALFASLGLAR